MQGNDICQVKLIFKKPNQRKKYPWEDEDHDPLDFSNYGTGKFYITKLFDPLAEMIGSKSSIDFESDGHTYSIRSSCLAKNSSTWKCAFGRCRADFILFLGFRNKIDPKLEFCLKIPLEKFKDRNTISISDDGYHIKGYQEFWIDPELFRRMDDYMEAIRCKDISKIEELFPELYPPSENEVC